MELRSRVLAGLLALEYYSTGGKKSKERVTCTFFVNAADGSKKPIVTGKSKSPRCFKAIGDTSQLPCSYFSQPKAWMDFNILDDVLSKLNRKLARERRNVIYFWTMSLAILQI